MVGWQIGPGRQVLEVPWQVGPVRSIPPPWSQVAFPGPGRDLAQATVRRSRGAMAPGQAGRSCGWQAGLQARAGKAQVPGQAPGRAQV